MNDKKSRGKQDKVRKIIENQRASERPGREAQEQRSSNVTPAAKTHTVASGDTLASIAQKHYGSRDKWQALYEANKEVIGDNPNLIRVGQVLKLPDLGTQRSSAG